MQVQSKHSAFATHSCEYSATDYHLFYSLAYAELFTTFAYVFRRFDLQLSGTTEHDMDWTDCYTPATFGHLKVLVKRVN
jgi:hypothetical protein